MMSCSKVPKISYSPDWGLWWRCASVIVLNYCKELLLTYGAGWTFFFIEWYLKEVMDMIRREWIISRQRVRSLQVVGQFVWFVAWHLPSFFRWTNNTLNKFRISVKYTSFNLKTWATSRPTWPYPFARCFLNCRFKFKPLSGWHVIVHFVSQVMHSHACHGLLLLL